MFENRTPRWLLALERQCRWLAIPNLGSVLVALQGLGFLLGMSDPARLELMPLIPSRVLNGEIWRLVTFLGMPMSMSPIWFALAMWFLYFIVTSIENQWGAFRTTFYVLISWVVTVVFSFLFDFPITSTGHFFSTLFLAASVLFPDFEVMLFFVVPVKMRWLGWLTLGYAGLEFLQGPWVNRLHLLAIYSNYLLFFAPAYLGRIKQLERRWKFKRRL